MKAHFIVPLALLGVGLVATAHGLVQETHQQAHINQDSQAIVQSLASTKVVTGGVSHRLTALHTMDGELLAVNSAINAANRQMISQSQQMAAILSEQEQIWSTLSQLNRSLTHTSKTLVSNQDLINVTAQQLSQPQGIVATTNNLNQLVVELAKASQSTQQILAQMNQKLALVGTLHHLLPSP